MVLLLLMHFFFSVYSVVLLFIGAILDYNPYGLVAFVVSGDKPVSYTISKCNQDNCAL